MAVTEKGVMVVTDKDAPEIFQTRALDVARALEFMPGLRSANVTLQRIGPAALKQFTLNANCEADDIVTAIAAMTATLNVFTEGLMHVIRRMPEGVTEQDFLEDKIHHLASVRASISNQPGERAAAQRGHEPIVMAGGPDVV